MLNPFDCFPCSLNYLPGTPSGLELTEKKDGHGPSEPADPELLPGKASEEWSR